MLRILFLFVLLSFICSPVLADEKDPNPFKLPDAVMALPKELKAGQPFMGYPKLSPQVSWHGIAPWMLGTWKSGEQRVTSSVDYETGAWYVTPTVEAAVVIESFGDLLDAEGTYWHAMISPNIQDYQKQQFIDSQNTISTKLLEVSDSHALIWSRVFHIVYNPAGRQIATSYTEERVTEYKPIGSHRMASKSYIRLYDSSGYLQRAAFLHREYVLTEKFQPRRHRAGIDLCDHLSSHLQAMGRHDLINW